MRTSRRNLLLLFPAACGLLFFRARVLSAQNPIPVPPYPRRSPSDKPDSSEDPAIPPAAAKKAILEQRQKDIRKEVEKLYDLAAELKAEVEKTDATVVLSLAMVRKAEEIEKLAKQIKDHAKG